MADLVHAAEGDTDLHGDPDAAHWAERFRAKWIIVAAPEPGETIPGFGAAEKRTEGVMLTWFAGAIETGRMAGFRAGAATPVARVVRQLLAALGHNYGPAWIAQLAAELAQPTPIAAAAEAALAGDDDSPVVVTRDDLTAEIRAGGGCSCPPGAADPACPRHGEQGADVAGG